VTTPYPTIKEWVVSDAAREATLDGVRPAGREARESGAFWLGARKAIAEVTVVVLPKGRGVEESIGHWQVTPEVFGEISRWAKPRGLTLLGIAHTHVRGVPARLSWSDRHRSVSVPGILSVVIGNGGEDVDHCTWGWYVYEGDDYREILRPELMQRVRGNSTDPVEVLRADSEGVWPLTS
jgi:hypothetical protein